MKYYNLVEQYFIGIVFNFINKTISKLKHRLKPLKIINYVKN